jgi:hypothetical protein
MATATATRRNLLPRGIWFFLLRGFTVGFGICSIAWAVLSINYLETSLASVAVRILKGEPFDATKLAELTQQLNSLPTSRLTPAALDDATLIRLKLFEGKLGTGTSPADSSDFAEIERALTVALSTNPNNSYFWLASYWLGSLRGDSVDHTSKLLRTSYETGPNEAWVAQRRNPIALESWESLPVDLVQRVLSEFAKLVQSGLYGDAANIVAGPGWPIHQQLLNALAPLDEAQRRAMARELERKDIEGATVPGIPDRPPSRPF